MTRPTVLGTKYAQGSQIIYQGLNQILNGQDAKNVLAPAAIHIEPEVHPDPLVPSRQMKRQR